jgi:hypothetical protein
MECGGLESVRAVARPMGPPPTTTAVFWRTGDLQATGTLLLLLLLELERELERGLFVDVASDDAECVNNNTRRRQFHRMEATEVVDILRRLSVSVSPPLRDCNLLALKGMVLKKERAQVPGSPRE